MLVGGSTTPYKLDEASIAKLVETSVRVADDGAAVFVTSPRTSASEVATLERMVDGAGEVVRWARDMPNPYGWLLAHANRFVVTEDSVSMAADAIATGKPGDHRIRQTSARAILARRCRRVSRTRGARSAHATA